MIQVAQTQTLNKGDVIYGNYNIPHGDYSYIRAMCVERPSGKEYLIFFDIYQYKTLLFPYSDNKVQDMISTFEALAQSSNKFTINKFFEELKKGNRTIYMNQKYMDEFLSSSKSLFYFKYMEGIVYKDELYKIFLLPENDVNIYIVDNITKGYIAFNN